MFFGCRHKNEDYIYEEELERAEKTEVLTKLSVAFSRDQEQKVQMSVLTAVSVPAVQLGFRHTQACKTWLVGKCFSVRYRLWLSVSLLAIFVCLQNVPNIYCKVKSQFLHFFDGHQHMLL